MKTKLEFTLNSVNGLPTGEKIIARLEDGRIIEGTVKSKPLKEGQEIDESVFVRKFKDGGWEVHGFNEDSAKEVISALKMLIPSQPIKEEEGECCGEWTGKDSYDCDKDGARTKQGTCKCKCHQEKETEYNPFEVTEEKVREAAEKGAKDQNEKYGKETPKKLPSEALRETWSRYGFSQKDFPLALMDFLDENGLNKQL